MIYFTRSNIIEKKRKILEELDKTRRPPRRDTTKIDFEAIRAIHELEVELSKARKIIRDLLGASPPRVWKKWPNLYKLAIKFLQYK